MGGRPCHALVTLALPGSATLAYAEGIYAGLGRAAERFGVKIVGGETARSPAGAFISVTVTGAIGPAGTLTRSGGKPDPRIYVTEGQWLVSRFPVSAMMDLSDGLGRDLPRLAAASGTGYVVDTAQLPLTPGRSVAQALGDGEDYELLFTMEPRHGQALEERWRARWPELELTRIGTLASRSIRRGLEDGAGFDHFAHSKTPTGIHGQ